MRLIVSLFALFAFCGGLTADNSGGNGGVALTPAGGKFYTTDSIQITYVVTPNMSKLPKKCKNGKQAVWTQVGESVAYSGEGVSVDGKVDTSTNRSITATATVTLTWKDQFGEQTNTTETGSETYDIYKKIKRYGKVTGSYIEITKQQQERKSSTTYTVPPSVTYSWENIGVPSVGTTGMVPEDASLPEEHPDAKWTGFKENRGDAPDVTYEGWTPGVDQDTKRLEKTTINYDWWREYEYIQELAPGEEAPEFP